MKVHFRGNEIKNYIAVFRDYLEDIQRLNNRTMGGLNEVLEQTKYDKLQNTISEIIDAYTETIMKNIKTNIFPVWEESGASLRSLLKMIGAGDGAEAVCVRIEKKLGDMIDEILMIEKERQLTPESRM